MERVLGGKKLPELQGTRRRWLVSQHQGMCIDSSYFLAIERHNQMLFEYGSDRWIVIFVFRRSRLHSTPLCTGSVDSRKTRCLEVSEAHAVARMPITVLRRYFPFEGLLYDY